MKHTAIYVRVSTKQQDTRSQDLELHAWADRQTTPLVWYLDKATGTNMDRPGMDKLLRAIAQGEVEQLVIWRLDRLGRTASGLTKLFEDLGKAKVNLVSLKDCLDLSTPAGRLMAHVLASVAAYETEVRSERQLAGIAAAKAAGTRWGGSSKGRLISVNQEQIKQVQTMHNEGKGVAEIARTVGLSRPTVYRLLGRAGSILG